MPNLNTDAGQNLYNAVKRWRDACKRQERIAAEWNSIPNPAQAIAAAEQEVQLSARGIFETLDQVERQ